MIEKEETACMRPSGPIIRVRVMDLTKLPGIIRIPSIIGGEVSFKEQLVSYSGLSNQCNRCRKFGHLFADCPLNKKRNGVPENQRKSRD